MSTNPIYTIQCSIELRSKNKATASRTLANLLDQLVEDGDILNADINQINEYVDFEPEIKQPHPYTMGYNNYPGHPV